MHKRLTTAIANVGNTNNNEALVFPPLTYSRWTQWLLKDTSKDCIIHQQTLHPHQQPSTSSSSSSSKSSSRKTTPTSSVYPTQPPNTLSPNHKRNNNMELIQLLAINALEFTAPVYSFLNKDSSPPPTSPVERTEQELLLTKKTSTELKMEREFIQLSGHQGTFAPAGPKSLWKKMPPDSHQEANIYNHLKTTPADPFVLHIPHFISQTHYNNTEFIELEDLTVFFDLKTLSIMDIKMGTRTFLESEVSNTKPRSDLFEKMYKIDPTAFTEDELEARAVTKLRYMQFREMLSSTTELGFRIEGVKCFDDLIDVNFQRLKDESTISSILTRFCSKFKPELRKKLIKLRSCLERSDFFNTHEMIGSSLLLIHDQEQCGCWIIDFAKTFKCDEGTILDHRARWELGNRADGILTGIDNLIRLM